MLSKQNQKKSNRRRIGSGVMSLEERRMLSADGFGFSATYSAEVALPASNLTADDGPAIVYDAGNGRVTVNGTDGDDSVRVFRDYNGPGSLDDQIVVELVTEDNQLLEQRFNNNQFVGKVKFDAYDGDDTFVNDLFIRSEVHGGADRHVVGAPAAKVTGPV